MSRTRRAASFFRSAIAFCAIHADRLVSFFLAPSILFAARSAFTLSQRSSAAVTRPLFGKSVAMIPSISSESELYVVRLTGPFAIGARGATEVSEHAAIASTANTERVFLNRDIAGLRGGAPVGGPLTVWRLRGRGG